MLNPSTLLQVPYLNFTTLRFTSPLLASGADPIEGEDYTVQIYVWNGPSQAVNRIAAAVTAQGVILPLTAPSPNSSWHLDFWGPSLKCGNVDYARRLRLESNIAAYYSQDQVNCVNRRNLYLSWFQDLPYPLTDDSYYDVSHRDLTSEPGSNAIITIAVLPGLLSIEDTCGVFSPEVFPDEMNRSSTANLTNPLGIVGQGSTMIQCQLFNSTYEADFVYVDGGQSITVNAPVKSSDEPVITFDYVGQRTADSVNGLWTSCFGLHSTSDGTLEIPEPCGFDPAILRVIAYQAVLEAFAGILRGTLTEDNANELIKNSSILSTTLVETKELAFLNEQTTGYLGDGADQFGPYDLQSALTNYSNIDVSAAPQVDPLASKRSLSDALEEMFRNLTISLMSSDLLR